MIAHLWTSTLVLLLAIVSARLLPLSARTRYAVLFCGLLKFALPAAVLSAPIRAIFGRQAAATISIAWLDPTAPLGRLAPPPASHWPIILQMVWIVPAIALASAWLIARLRVVASALRGASPASASERAALETVRREMQLRRSVDVIRSPVCEAPAVMRIIRPVIVLPDGGCESLDPAELESLLRHECAHVARADNAAAVIEYAIVAAFWFHPLVWIAKREIAAAREQACDERAAFSAEGIEIYMSALSKTCSAALTPKVAGVSCMASAHLKERLEHLMRFQSHRALSHRLVVLLAVLVVAGATLASDMKPSDGDTLKQPYRLIAEVRPGDSPDSLLFSGRIVDNATHRVFARPIATFKRGGNVTIRVGENDGSTEREAIVEVRDAGSSVTAVMHVTQDGAPVQETTIDIAPKEYSGAPISINLKDADIKDVLRTFAQLTSTKIEFPDTLQGKVTLNIRDTPWDKAFENILSEQHLTWEMQGKTIVIREQ